MSSTLIGLVLLAALRAQEEVRPAAFPSACSFTCQCFLGEGPWPLVLTFQGRVAGGTGYVQQTGAGSVRAWIRDGVKEAVIVVGDQVRTRSRDEGPEAAPFLGLAFNPSTTETGVDGEIDWPESLALFALPQDLGPLALAQAESISREPGEKTTVDLGPRFFDRLGRSGLARLLWVPPEAVVFAERGRDGVALEGPLQTGTAEYWRGRAAGGAVAIHLDLELHSRYRVTGVPDPYDTTIDVKVRFVISPTDETSLEVPDAVARAFDAVGAADDHRAP